MKIYLIDDEAVFVMSLKLLLNSKNWEPCAAWPAMGWTPWRI